MYFIEPQNDNYINWQSIRSAKSFSHLIHMSINQKSAIENGEKQADDFGPLSIRRAHIQFLCLLKEFELEKYYPKILEQQSKRGSGLGL